MLDDLQSYASEIVKREGVPAIALAVWDGHKQYQGAAGILNLDTHVEATTDSIFQIGSITKVMTTCLVLKLVDRGLVELDGPVKRYLRSFSVADKTASDLITVRQLLNHTNGIAGDYFPDDVNEDGPHIARYVDRCAQLPLVHPVGAGFSYSNAAFAIAGRLVEVVAGLSWYDAIEEWIYQPLDMTQAICRPEQMIRFRTALGHIPDKEGGWRTCSGKLLTMGQAPAGTTLTMTASNLLRFGRAHLNEGSSQGEKPWLSDGMIKLMQTPTVNIPVEMPNIQQSLGMGWFCYKTLNGDQFFIDHAGATNGQLATLRLFPERHAGFALLMNCGDGAVLKKTVAELTSELSGIECRLPEIDGVALTEEQLQLFTGHYHAYAGDYYFYIEQEALVARFDDAVDEGGAFYSYLTPLGDMSFVTKNERGDILGQMSFIATAGNQQPDQLLSGMRLYTKVTH